MKRVFVAVSVLTAALTIALLFGVYQHPSLQLETVAIQSTRLDREALTQRLAELIRIPVIADADDYAAQMSVMQAKLRANYQRVFSTLDQPVTSNDYVLLRWQGLKPELKPLLMVAHLDVVVVEEESSWQVPPFSGAIDEEFIWGRGALDNKSSVAAWIEAIDLLIARGFKPQRTLYFAFGGDEESDGELGAQMLAAYFREQGLHFEFIIDEGLFVTSGVMRGVAAPIASIGVAEKGYASFMGRIETDPGHSSIPKHKTAITQVSKFLQQLDEKPLPARIDGATKHMFRYFAPEFAWRNRLLTSNLWLTESLVVSQLIKEPVMRALVQTTMVPSIFRAGEAKNVLPASAQVTINTRILPGDSVDRVEQHLQDLANPFGVRIQRLSGTSEPSLVSRVDQLGFKLLSKTTRELFPDAIVAPALVIAATDSRHYRGLADDTYRFVPAKLNRQDIDRIHGNNERISIENYLNIVAFYLRFLEQV